MTLRRLLPSALLLALLLPAAAEAEYGPGADPASVDYARLEQGDDTTLDADLTPDARYVAIQTRATNFFADDDPDPPGLLRRGGIFRYDRVARQLAFVADGDMVREEDGSAALRGAANPSISDDGRFIAFSTAQSLTPADTNDNVDVYVRDMAVPVGQDRAASGAYTLVSARDGSGQPATYAPRETPLPGRNPGADLTPNVAISGDGRRVAFRTVEVASDLPASGTADTPPGQVFVRDLWTQRTLLQTARSTDGSPAGGATGPAALSGDGSTVVWVGTNAPDQTRFLNGERADPDVRFYLWRRADGGPTRRVTGEVDPDDPACDGTPVRSVPTATGPCYGPLSTFEEDLSNIGQSVPAVSRDGNRVAFLSSAGLRPTSNNQTGLDLFVTDMSPGVSRKAGTIEVTRDPLGGDARSTGGIQSVAMSADGQHVVIATIRTRFVLPTYVSLGTFRSQSDTNELYLIDLQDRTIDRVVRGLSGGDAGGDAGATPTLSADGSAVAFTSQASNLFFGDANGRADAFVTTKIVPRTGGGTPPPTANQPPAGFDVDEGPPELGIALKRRTDGGLDVTLRAPGAGTVQLAASTSSSSARGATSAATKKATLATATRKVTKAGKVTLALKPGTKAKALLKKSKRVALTVRVAFAPKAGGATVAETETSSFVRAKKKAPAKKKKAPAKKKKRS